MDTEPLDTAPDTDAPPARRNPLSAFTARIRRVGLMGRFLAVMIGAVFVIMLLMVVCGEKSAIEKQSEESAIQQAAEATRTANATPTPVPTPAPTATPVPPTATPRPPLAAVAAMLARDEYHTLHFLYELAACRRERATVLWQEDMDNWEVERQAAASAGGDAPPPPDPPTTSAETADDRRDLESEFLADPKGVVNELDAARAQGGCAAPARFAAIQGRDQWLILRRSDIVPPGAAPAAEPTPTPEP